MEKLVSIILPVYNVEKYIQICLGSISAQTYPNIEVILVDDGSTDCSGAICDKYAKGKRVKVIHQENTGVSTARNRGIDSATGEYICFADSDDILMPDYVSYLVGLLERNEVDVAVTTSFFTSFGGKQVVTDKVKVMPGEDAAASILYYHIPIGCYCKIFKRNFLNDYAIRFIPSVYIGEGFNFNVKAFSLADRVAVGQRKIYCYRRDNTESAMTKFRIQKCEMALRAIDIIRESLIIKSEKMYSTCDFAKWHTYGDMYNWMSLANVIHKYPKMYLSCYQTIRNYSWRAFCSPINKKEKIRAILQLIHPKLLVFVLKLRLLNYKIYHKIKKFL